MNKVLLSALFGVALGIGSAQAEEVIIRTRPPRAVVETRIARPSREHVWIGGYHRWQGNAYVWTPAVGTFHRGVTQDGWLRDMSVATAGMFSWKATGGSSN